LNAQNSFFVLEHSSERRNACELFRLLEIPQDALEKRDRVRTPDSRRKLLPTLEWISFIRLLEFHSISDGWLFQYLLSILVFWKNLLVPAILVLCFGCIDTIYCTFQFGFCELSILNTSRCSIIWKNRWQKRNIRIIKRVQIRGGLCFVLGYYELGD